MDDRALGRPGFPLMLDGVLLMLLCFAAFGVSGSVRFELAERINPKAPTAEPDASSSARAASECRADLSQ